MQAVWQKSSSITRAAFKFFKVVLLVLLFFLLQTVVIPHLKIAGIMPNLLMVIIAILTVSYGKLYAFISGALIGIILEAMSYSIPLYYLLIYPVLALLCAQVFADMSDIKREMRRIREAQRLSEAEAQIQAPFMRRRFRIRIRLRRDSPHDLNAHLRILLNTLMLVFLFEGVMMLYIALSGISVTFNHIARILYTAAYTAVCCVVMFPIRAWLGLYKRPRRMKVSEEGEMEVTTNREILRQIALVPDDVPEPKKQVFQFLRKKPKVKKEEPKQDKETVDEADSSIEDGEVPTS
ncbi:MAG: hypothetical protein GXZ04_04015 [Clostridiales bacterium]|nr:hypothetical protein [Clostridiales bacterium]